MPFLETKSKHLKSEPLLDRNKIPRVRGESRKKSHAQAIQDEKEWTAIPGWPEYMISPKGKVQSVERWTTSTKHDMSPMLLKPSLLRHTQIGNYYIVTLSRGGKGHKVYLHKLLQDTFMGPCPEGYTLRFDPGYRHNPCLSFLYYMPKKGVKADPPRIYAPCLNRKPTKDNLCGLPIDGED